MPRVDSDFRQRVEDLVAKIPTGKLMTYGQIAGLCGAAWAAWEVGQIAHFGDPKVPWQRVVNKKGGLAVGYPGGRAAHKKALEDEHIEVVDDKVLNLEELLWWPS
jgi:methylated-DNA-protein-cysteine methyltransferase-like protein